MITHFCTCFSHCAAIYHEGSSKQSSQPWGLPSGTLSRGAPSCSCSDGPSDSLVKAAQHSGGPGWAQAALLGRVPPTQLSRGHRMRAGTCVPQMSWCFEPAPSFPRGPCILPWPNDFLHRFHQSVFLRLQRKGESSQTGSVPSLYPLGPDQPGLVFFPLEFKSFADAKILLAF